MPNDATDLMGLVAAVCMKYMLTAPDKETASIHMVKAGGILAAAGIGSQLNVPPEHAEAIYKAGVDAMFEAAKKIMEKANAE